VVIGAAAEPRSLLSPCEWADVFLDQMAQVRRGERKNGVWHLEVDRASEYAFELRRWPADADLSLSAASLEFRGEDGTYPAGAALPIAKARLKIGDFDQTVAVDTDDKGVAFQLSLKRGPADLETWFYDQDGKELCGAYFVYVERK
jgi:hypothetical protein